MLFVHETHTVSGAREEDFEAAFRDGWIPAAAASDARLLWFLHQAHGTGPAYTVVTVTAVPSADSWRDLTRRLTAGNLRPWVAEVDALRVDLVSKILIQVEWSPFQELDLDTVPAEPQDHDPAIFMEDTAWPHQGKTEDYLALAGTKYVETLRKSAEAGHNLLDLEAVFRPAWGTGRHREIILWQRVAKPEALLPLLSSEVPPEYRGPGTWMHDALDVRDRWESRLLRTSSWSPLP